MVEGPTAKAYAIKVNQEFKDEIVKDVFCQDIKKGIHSTFKTHWS
jgi:hypothetical protein